MKTGNKTWIVRLSALALAGACLCGGVALASGDEKDPLISLSYLTKTVTPEILEQVEENAEKRQEELEETFQKALEDHEEQAGQNAATPVGSETYAVVALSNGQKLNLGVGCEVMLRVGAATLTANTAPGLIDVSSGGTLGNGENLTTNHLYMATIADRYLTASGEVVKLLVRGEYTIS